MKRSERQEVGRAAVALLLALAVLLGVPTLDWKSRPEKPGQKALYQATLGGEGAPAPAGEPGAAAEGVHVLDKEDVEWAQTLKAGLEDVEAAAEAAGIAGRDGMPETANMDLLWGLVDICALKGCTNATAAFAAQALAEHTVNYLLAQARLKSGGGSAEDAEHVLRLYNLSLQLEDNPNVKMKYAKFLRQVGQAEPSFEMMKAAMMKMPYNAQGYLDLAHVLHDNQMFAEALAMVKSAQTVANGPYKNLADVSEETLQEALLLEIYLEKRVADGWHKYDAVFPKFRELVPPGVGPKALKKRSGPASQAIHELHPWMAINYPIDPALKLEYTQAFAAKLERSALAYGVRPAVFRAKEYAARWADAPWKPRVGFVSADFRQKATTYLCKEHFRFFDRDAVEVFIYSSTPDENPPSTWRRDILDHADHFVDIARMPVDEASARIRSDKIDILVNMDGYSNEGMRSDVFATRNAPVQLSWFVYIGSMGSQYVDYIVTDKVASPPQHEAWYSEKFLYLPESFFPVSHAFLYPEVGDAAGAERRRLRAKYGLPKDGFVLASFNKFIKLDKHLWEVWMDLLKAIPGSTLWLLKNPTGAEAHLRAHAKEQGVDPARIVFLDFVKTSEEHFARIHLADVILDTTVYGAHTGAADAIWAEVPFVTCVGACMPEGVDPVNADGMAARVGGSLLAGVRTPELIAGSLDEYRDLVLRLHADPAFRQDVRRKLREGKQHLHPKAYAEHFTNALLLAWRHFLGGKERAHLWAPFARMELGGPGAEAPLGTGPPAPPSRRVERKPGPGAEGKEAAEKAERRARAEAAKAELAAMRAAAEDQAAVQADDRDALADALADEQADALAALSPAAKQKKAAAQAQAQAEAQARARAELDAVAVAAAAKKVDADKDAAARARAELDAIMNAATQAKAGKDPAAGGPARKRAEAAGLM